MMLTIVTSVIGLAAISPAVAMRLIFLAPTRLGFINYYSLVFSEMLVKRLGATFGVVEYWLFTAGAVLLGIGLGAEAGLLIAAAFMLLDLWIKQQERNILTSPYGTEDTLGMSGEAKSGLLYPEPSSNPKLTLNLNGPFVSRLPDYQLGSLIVGRTLQIELVVGNHSILTLQERPQIAISSSAANVELSKQAIEPIGPGEVDRIMLTITADKATGEGEIRIDIHYGDISRQLKIKHQAAVAEATPVKAEITRYPGGCQTAFAWRGDMDAYCTSTFQSIEGLENCFGLAARYRFPQTMYISTRLSNSLEEATEFWDQWGVMRGQENIPDFNEWMRQKVDLQHRLAYPFESHKPYAIELGNHGHLHFGTHMSPHAANGWAHIAKIGAARYPWQGEATDSETEQRDNAIEANRISVKEFGFEMKSWAMPNRSADEHTAAAMWAAGCEVLSDSDITVADNLLRQPPPHHPHDTDAVELTKRYPGDPESIFHAAMIKYWIHRGHRLQIPVLFMCHQHMRLWAGYACTRFTEHVLDYVLNRFNGDLHINTVFGIGEYWNFVFSPKNKALTVRIEGSQLVLENSSDRSFTAVPVDVELSNGGRVTYLVDSPAGEQIRVSLLDSW